MNLEELVLDFHRQIFAKREEFVVQTAEVKLGFKPSFSEFLANGKRIIAAHWGGKEKWFYGDVFLCSFEIKCEDYKVWMEMDLEDK